MIRGNLQSYSGFFANLTKLTILASEALLHKTKKQPNVTCSKN